MLQRQVLHPSDSLAAGRYGREGGGDSLPLERLRHQSRPAHARNGRADHRRIPKAAALRATTHFAEWFSLDPPYPQFGPHPANSYINGGIASFTAGELAKAALDEGREEYGVDILRRVAQKVAADKAIYFLYTLDGKNQGGGPSGWGAAAVMSALVEGLAGIHDDGALFDEVTISPRFAAAGLDRAQVCVRYGPSPAYIALGYEHHPAERLIALRLAGVAKKANLRVLLPKEATTARVLSPAGLCSGLETVEQSRYLVFELSAPLTQNCQVRVQYDRRSNSSRSEWRETFCAPTALSITRVDLGKRKLLLYCSPFTIFAK